MPPAQRAEILSIGTELLLGQIVDTNAAYLARRLGGLAIDLLYVSTVGDNLERATAAFARAFARSDLVISTGGLGPTEDDLTREAIAAALDRQPSVDPELERQLRAWFAGRTAAMPERNVKQAWLIPGARALPNPLGSAPGWLVEDGRRRVVAMPGVPREMTRMWEIEVEPLLSSGKTLRSRTLKTLGIGESTLEERISDLVRSTAPTVATYAKNDGVHIRLTDKGPDPLAVDARIAAMEARVRERIPGHVWGTDDDTLAGVVGTGLRQHGWRLATAEALTGGEVARTLSAEGAPWYRGGFVLPGASSESLARSIEHLAAEVTLIVPDQDAGELVARSPRNELTQSLGPWRGAEGARRTMLAGLDLLRKLLA